MKSTASIKYLRISSKKIKTLGKMVVGLPPQEAIDRLVFSGTKAGRILSKVIQSAYSNSVNNLRMNTAKLKIKSVMVNKGPMFKRWNPVSRGIAHSIKKRTSHIKIQIEEVDKLNIKKKEINSEKEKVIQKELKK
ncbi:50S ribosomal protein L22 [Candidatus Gottesmanbacteria bacterium CG11_big_fil_rev_8_21_14_0_20_37_11]|uniref:Large ribosomal subunit protein uL22 n=3 Tax=Candidatus Gottesmaniibacteriota TaxID=1752720 RepID=A0A2M7RQS2_9BACT|nr:MAG: 50S ribosomal protein L22 [Candidatus Gottesmanbacteria bacterium CG1_02_37_22]PIP32616.1 MAG: 50S ribosomal protein L22 [Candidatus Gottesmanbacteria bacterium CG23_combo_of_CG06-09_8_20_14_all_37_19]PIR08492.1 MAG: 50S ribosomal protein L22 [Candidatus Gottesmanbacteria bacterium CG11_big_fil_rev_8_21_14_0_20_37_11]PIZ02632.1 MAG: 50S ribosomal protein L22 [Candidatus Gottesmanbacteria bacterium CG_4_10_14_0_8_um_filter_37_24]